MEEEVDKATLNFRDRDISAFKNLLTKLKKYAKEIKSDFSDQRKQLRELKILLESLPQVKSYMRKFVGPLKEDHFKSKRNKTIKLLAENLLGITSLKNTLDEKEKMSLNARRDIKLFSKQKKYFQEIPESIRKFLPETITVEVDSKGVIKSIDEMYGNTEYTLKDKLDNQRKLLKNFDSIKGRLSSGLNSKEEVEHLSSLVGLIILETGIRPGRLGNKVVDGDSEIETFGAITLKREHIKFTGGGKAQLKFKGKKGAVNEALVKDSKVVKALKELVGQAKSKGFKYIFSRSDGSEYNYSHLSSFFSKNFDGIKITDFRKLKATEEVYNSLRDQRKIFLKKLIKYKDLDPDEMSSSITKELCKVLEKAHGRAKLALSHDNAKTTKQSYINPEVILHFLSTVNLKGSLRECILNKKVKLQFDPLDFIREAKKI